MYPMSNTEPTGNHPMSRPAAPRAASIAALKERLRQVLKITGTSHRDAADLLGFASAKSIRFAMSAKCADAHTIDVAERLAREIRADLIVKNAVIKDFQQHIRSLKNDK
jgi:hypothetical protein